MYKKFLVFFIFVNFLSLKIMYYFIVYKTFVSKFTISQIRNFHYNYMINFTFYYDIFHFYFLLILFE